MALVLDEEQQMLRDAARGFFAKQAPLTLVRELRDAGDASGQRAGLWQEMAELGWCGLTLPEAFGGLDYDEIGLGLVFEESGRTLTASPLLSTTALCGSLLARLGNKTQQQAWLPAICAGETVMALALEEGARHAPDDIKLSCGHNSRGVVMNGHKTNVIDGHLAEHFLVVARTDAGLRVVVVPRDAAGLEMRIERQVDARYVAALKFTGVDVPAGAVLAGNDTEAALERTLDTGRVCLAAELLGISTEAFERTLEYLKARKQFGVPIGSFQGLQHRAAILFGELELTRSAVLRALYALADDSADAAKWVSLAKAKACETAQLAATEAVQLHGGIGMTDELDIGFFLKRARVAQNALGDYGYHLQRFANCNGY